MLFQIENFISASVKKVLALPPKIYVDHEATISLDRNENPFGSPYIKWYNRYPKPEKRYLESPIFKIKAINKENFILLNGDFSALDLLIRCFCNSGIDNFIVCNPEIDNFNTLALLNNVTVKYTPLLDDFQLDLIHIEHTADEKTSIIFLGSPDSISGNALNRNDVEMVLNNFRGLVVIDETYINYSRKKSFVSELADYPNLIVLQNFDTAWGLAGLGVSMVMASKEIISVLGAMQELSKVNIPTEEILFRALEEVGMVNDMTKELVQMREAMKKVLEKFPFVEHVYPSDANFLLVKMSEAGGVYEFLLKNNIAVKNCSHLQQFTNCLRITIGTEDENTKLVEALVGYFDEHWKLEQKVDS